MGPVLLASSIALLDPHALVRVEEPGHPDAIGGSAVASVLAEPPPPGTPWRWEPIPEPDRWTDPRLLDVTNADLWQADGLTGAGVKIAIFDIGWYAPDAEPPEIGEVSTHDCWVSPSCEEPIDPQRPRFGHEVGIHGYGCAEVVHDLAPGAELHLVRTSSLVGFENAAAWAIREGIDVISMSMSFYNDSFYDGGSPRFDRVLTQLEQHDVLLVTSAGNNAQKHWAGRFTDHDGDGWMDFDGENGLRLDLPRSGNLYVNWNQHGSCGETDLDARIVDDEGTIYAWSTITQDPDADSCSPVERLRPVLPTAQEVWLQVSHRRGVTGGVDVKVLTREGEVVEAMPEGAITDPASHPLTFAVGAVRADGYLGNGPESFSSWGPNAAGFPKPEIAGPDGLTTDAYGPVGFFGTSASAPAVAGMLALILEDDPSLSPREAARKLQGWAWGDDLRDADPRWGAGKARLPVRDPGVLECGRRPLVALLLFPPLGWLRRRRSRDAVVGCGTAPPRADGERR